MTLFVINVGDVDYGKITLPIIEKLCDFNNINIYVLDRNLKQNKFNLHPSWLKLFCHDIINDDFIISWDLDLVPLKTYDLKSLFNKGYLNLCQDTSIIFSNQKFNHKFKYNCGLIGVPKIYQDTLNEIYNKFGKYSTYPSFEQYYFNDYIFDYNIRINEIDYKYNYLFKDDLNYNDIFNLHFTWNVPSENKINFIEKTLKKINLL